MSALHPLSLSKFRPIEAHFPCYSLVVSELAATFSEQTIECLNLRAMESERGQQVEVARLTFKSRRLLKSALKRFLQQSCTPLYRFSSKSLS